MLFSELMEAVRGCGDLAKVLAAIEKLLEIKALTPESGAGERIEVLNHFIEGQLDYYKTLLDKKTDDRRESWDVLDRLFLESLKVR